MYKVLVFAHASIFEKVKDDIYSLWREGKTLEYIYMFHGIKPENWGDFCDRLILKKDDLRKQLRFYHDLGFTVGAYIDVSEASNKIAKLYPDAILENSEYFVRMSLDPNKSWFKSLKRCAEEMKEIGFDALNLDRCDLVGEDEKEEEYLKTFINEINLNFVCNTLKPWQYYLSSHPSCLFVGTDGVPPNQIYEYDLLYQSLAKYSKLKKHYLAPKLNENIRSNYADTVLLMENPLIGVNDYHLKTILPLDVSEREKEKKRNEYKLKIEKGGRFTTWLYYLVRNYRITEFKRAPGYDAPFGGRYFIPLDKGKVSITYKTTQKTLVDILKLKMIKGQLKIMEKQEGKIEGEKTFDISVERNTFVEPRVLSDTKTVNLIEVEGKFRNFKK
jgi:hypothetical protein